MFGLKKKFHALKRKDVPKDALSRQRRRLVAYMAERPLEAVPAPQVHAMLRFSFKPLMAALTAAFVVTSTGGVVFAAQGSLPGEALYRVKAASEEVRARFALSADAKFLYRSGLAEKRLEEAENLYGLELPEEGERERRLAIALRRYDDHVERLNDLAEKFESQERPRDPANALEAIDRVLATHARLIASASASVEVGAGEATDEMDEESEEAEDDDAEDGSSSSRTSADVSLDMRDGVRRYEEGRRHMREGMLRLHERLSHFEGVRERMNDVESREVERREDDDERRDESTESREQERPWEAFPLKLDLEARLR